MPGGVPGKSGSYLPDFASKRTNCPRGWMVRTKIWFPSVLGNGANVLVGPEVNWTGPWFTRWKRLPASRMAQISATPPRDDWKTKYLPSGVQLPQHSAGGVFQPVSSGCRPLPSGAISQMAEPLAPFTVKRNRVPLGDQRGHEAVPAEVASRRGSDPSPLAM